MYLKYENHALKNNVTLLKSKLDSLEKDVVKIYYYNNFIYSQILGMYVDTTNINILDIISDNDIEKIDFYSELIKFRADNFNYEILKNIMDNYPTISPIKSENLVSITSEFGKRKHPILRKTIFHEGVDITATKGTNVYATANGVISKLKHSRFGFGNHIVIEHLYGYKTLYAHLSVINVKKDQIVKKGDLIGKVGNSGLSTSPHLHYELMRDGKKVNPQGYFYTYVNN
jgi:murein DD-endopeptidase MepM/ murein hydrolase activator NlpD